MPSDCVSYKKSGYFSKLMVDYLDETSNLKGLYNRFPSIENFKLQWEEKQKNFPTENRKVLVEQLKLQYKNTETSIITAENIALLSKENTFTIATGHQLNLFTGPLYFLYKIVSTINLCKELKQNYPSQNFIPVYWMATEDHDFDEINHFWLGNNKIEWKKESFGPVGRLSTEGLDAAFKHFDKEIGIVKNAEYLKKLFKKGYLENENLAEATRYIANELFKNEGLVILDGDSKALKSLFVPFAKEELLNQTASLKVLETNKQLANYKIQVNPREINLFYIEDNLRERIVLENDRYSVLNTNLQFTKEELLKELEKNTEKFSPNVILRPLYQEVVLPNLCYIGGGGELAYWLELKSNFDANKITFPMLLLRNSVVIATEKQIQKADKLKLSWADLFKKQKDLLDLKTKDLSNLTIDFSAQKEMLKKQFLYLNEVALQTDKSFVGAVKAQEIKQIKGLENLEKRLLKAEKRKLSEELNRIEELQNELFPKGTLQERKANFSEFYAKSGDKMIIELLENLKPLNQSFSILKF